ncbi:MAG TPA: hypothetical protein VFR47_25810 [Anaerolineales bacterium]|nr:hypothetical protein [Anaerolineales bacterium]
MKIDIGEVLTDSWQMTWKHKVLWIYGLAFGLMISILFPLFFIPVLLPFLIENFKSSFIPLALLGGYVIVISVFILALYPVNVLTQVSLTLGILGFERENANLPIVDMMKMGLPFFWRVLGLMLLYSMGVTVIMLMIQGVVMLVTILTFGLGMFCMMPFMFLTYPALYLVIVWMEQAMNGIIIDDQSVMEAARQGWYLIRNNLLVFGLMALVIYFGVGMVVGAMMMPLMTPMFILPIGFMENTPNWTILVIALLGMLVLAPLYALLSGWAMAFTKSAWVFTYLRLTRSTNESQPLLQATPA